MEESSNDYCYYSGLPSPMAYMDLNLDTVKKTLTKAELDRVIEMAWEDRTPFEAIKFQFGLNETDVKLLMKKHLKFASYKVWRIRVEACKTKHLKLRNNNINRFKSKLQRQITHNKISKKN